MNTVLYIRVSTQEQAEEGFSIDAQRDKLINYCKAHEWGVTNIYVDPGFSGSNLKRPDIQKLISDAKDKKFERVLVWKLDRLSRSQKDTLYLIEDVFLKNNIDFVSMLESFDTSTAFGRAMIGILSVFAQLERENFRERSKLGKHERAKQGLWKGGNPPLGYDYIDGQLVPNEKAPIIKKVYDLYLKGAGTPTIMKETGLRHGACILCYLKSPIYAGKIASNGELFDGTHEPIITYETFLEAQRLRALRVKKRGHLYKNPFGGLILCRRCNARYYKHKGSGKYQYYYYSCRSRSLRASLQHGHSGMVKDPNCRNDSWRAEKLESAIWENIKSVICDEKKVQELLGSKAPEKRTNTTKIKKDITVIDQKISKLMDLYLDNKMPLEMLKAKLNEMETQRTVLASIVAEEENKSDEKEWIENQFKSVAASIDDLEPPTQRELLATIIKAIWLDGKAIEIEWRV